MISTHRGAVARREVAVGGTKRWEKIRPHIFSEMTNANVFFSSICIRYRQTLKIQNKCKKLLMLQVFRVKVVKVQSFTLFMQKKIV